MSFAEVGLLSYVVEAGSIPMIELFSEVWTYPILVPLRQLDIQWNRLHEHVHS